MTNPVAAWAQINSGAGREPRHEAVASREAFPDVRERRGDGEFEDQDFSWRGLCD